LRPEGVLSYGAGFVAQGAPADMGGLALIIEEGIRFPGFAFMSVQSPCVTFGQRDAQLKAHTTMVKRLESLGHDPTNRLTAMALAQEYGRSLHTGIFYRDPHPRPTYEDHLTGRREPTVLKEHILQRFLTEPRADS